MRLRLATKRLSRDSWSGQRKRPTLGIQRLHGLVDRLIESDGISKGVMREMMRLEVMPDGLDVVQFGRILGEPLDGKPVRPGGERRQGELAGMNRTVVLDQHHGLGRLTGLGTIKPVQLLEMRDEVAAALGRAGVDDELARDVIERAQHGDLLGLAGRRHTQVRPRLGPDAGEIGMGQRLALVAVEQNNVAGFGLLLAQLQTQADPFDLPGDLAPLEGVPRPPPAELFFRSALDSCDRLMRTPARASISARSRGIVQLRRSATGCSSKGVTTRKAASLFIGAGPGATWAFSAATPPRMKSLRHRRTVSSRTPNASAILELVQPDSVKSTARARSASLRSREPARAKRPARCSSLVVTADFPAMPYTLRIGAGSKPQKTYPLVSQTESA